MHNIRDQILAELSPNFSAEQLQMIDIAVAKALKGKRITEEETIPATTNSGMPEVKEYLARKKSKGLTLGTLEQYRQVLTAFMAATQKNISDIQDWDVLRFLDQYESYRGVGRRVFPHLIRHTTATHLYQHGMRLEDLQILLGHEKADTTRIYAKDDPSITRHAYMMAA